MARRASPDRSIGERIKDRRQLFGWSIRHAADRAGMSHTTWGRIEKGEVSADNRFTLASIAEALQCSVAELAGQPFAPADEVATSAQAAVYGVRNALVEFDFDEPPTTVPRPLPGLVEEADLIGHLRAQCDYAGAAARLPALLRELHAATQTSDRADALRLTVLTADNAAFVVRYLGYPAESWLAAERAKEAALETGDPVMLGMAAWSRGHAASGCGLYDRSLNLAERGLANLEPHLGIDGALEVAGQLHLTAAFALYALGRVDDAANRVLAAEEIAARTGETRTFRLNFGPSNIRVWKLSMEVDGGEPGSAVEIARDTDVSGLASVPRQGAFYLDIARALARLGRDSEAVRMLIAAERVAPQRIRNSPLAVECARSLLDRAQRNAVGSELRGFAERIGIASA